MAIASQFDAQRRRRCGSRRLLLLQSVVRRCVDAVAAVAVTGRMRSVGRLEQPRDTMARQTSARFRIRIGSTSFVPYFDQRRDSDVEQEILETEAMTDQQDRKKDGQIVMDRIVLLQNDTNTKKKKKTENVFCLPGHRPESTRPYKFGPRSKRSSELPRKSRTSGRQFDAEEGDVIELVVVDLVANGHDDVADETVAQLGRVRQLAQNVGLGLATGTGDVVLEEVAIERVEGFGQGHDGSEDGLLDFGVSVGKGKDFAAASHSAAARRRTGTGRRIQLAAFRL